MATTIPFVWDKNPDENIDFFEMKENGIPIPMQINEPFFDVLMTDKPAGEYIYAVRAHGEFGFGEYSDPITVNFYLPSKVIGFMRG